ncbi:hypothetical protein ACFE04_022653 [Oxalis oulophora]
MATKSLMARPYIISSAKVKPLFGRFLQQKKALYVVVDLSKKPSSSSSRSTTTNFNCVSSFSCLNNNNNNNNKNKNKRTTPSIIIGIGRSNFFTTRASTPVSQPGSFDVPLMQHMETKIKEHLNAQLVTVKDLSGDGRHVYIDVVAEAFEGQSAMNRQRMVYKAIWEELQSVVHAVDKMTTMTPGEATAAAAAQE